MKTTAERKHKLPRQYIPHKKGALTGNVRPLTKERKEIYQYIT
jgi:hypothetical protein